MRLGKSARLSLETLENRDCPSATVIYDGSNLTIRTDNLPQTVIITATSANRFDVMINASTQNYGITGNINVTTGNSDDQVTLNLANSSLLGNFTVNTGGSIPFFGDRVDINPFPSAAGTILGSVSLTNPETVNVQSTTIRGNLTVNDANKGFNFVNLGLSTVGGSFNFTGSSSGLASNNVSLSTSTVGSVSANLGSNGGYSDDTTSTVLGNLSVSGSAVGNKFVTLNGRVNGMAIIGLGAGFNFLDFASTASVGGSFFYTAGNGTNLINTFQGTIGGNLSISLGNGTNTIGNTATDFTPTVGGTSVNIILGNGTNNTTIGAGTSASNARLTVVQGNGDNTLNIGSNSFKSGNVIFGSGTHSFTGPVGGFTFPLTVRYL